MYFNSMFDLLEPPSFAVAVEAAKSTKTERTRANFLIIVFIKTSLNVNKISVKIFIIRIAIEGQAKAGKRGEIIYGLTVFKFLEQKYGGFFANKIMI